MPMKSGLFSLILGKRVWILRLDRMVLPCRHARQAVTRGRGGVNKLAGSGGTRTFEHVHRSLHVNRHVFRRPFDGRDDVADAGKVENVFCATKQAVSGRETADISALEHEIGATCMMRKILLAPANQVIDYSDRKTAVEEQINHMTADKSGAPGNNGEGTRRHAA